MSYDKRRLEALLKWYRQEVGKDLVAVFILGRDSKIIEYLTNTTVKDVDSFIQSFSDIMGIILEQIAKKFTLGSFGAGTFDTAQYRFIFCEAGFNSILVTVLYEYAKTEPYFPYAYLVAEKVARIFEGIPVSPVIPKIYLDQNIQTLKKKEGTLQKLRVAASDYAYKLVLGGDGAVGKTSMVQRFVEGVFRTDYKATIGTSITKKECNFKGLESKVRFVIWDLAGQQQFEKVRGAYLANSKAGLLVFDITRRDSFDNIKHWFEQIKTISPEIILVLCANKTDLKNSRVVSTTEGENLAIELGISYIETSALTGENINDAFRMIALQLIKRFFEAEDVTTISDFSQPQIIKGKVPKEKPEADLGDYKKIPLTIFWKDFEKDFIPWLENNIETLNKNLDFSIIPIQKDDEEEEISIDMLAQDKLGNKVLIEAHHGESNNKDYSLLNLLMALPQYNAKKAILICEEPTFELKRLINWLNDNSLEDVFFYLIKIEIFRVGNSPLTPLFMKICGPSKEIKQKRRKEVELNYIEKLRIKFWEHLIEKIYTSFPDHANITPSKTSWIDIDAGKNGIKYVYVIKKDSAEIKLVLDHLNERINRERFKELVLKKGEINKEFDELSWQTSGNLNWNFVDGRNFQTISYDFNTGGLDYEDEWENLQIKMVDGMKCLVRVLESRLSS